MHLPGWILGYVPWLAILMGSIVFLIAHRRACGLLMVIGSGLVLVKSLLEQVWLTFSMNTPMDRMMMDQLDSRTRMLNWVLFAGGCLFAAGFWLMVATMPGRRKTMAGGPRS